MKKLLICLGLTALLWSCVDEHLLNKNYQDFGVDKEYVNEIQKALSALGGNISFPVSNKESVKMLSRGVPYSTDARVEWDEARVHHFKNKVVVMIPIYSEDELLSKIVYNESGVNNYKFSKTFSRLVAIYENEKCYMKVFTYLPDSEYAENNMSKLDTIGCFAEYSNYQGLLLTSTIDGKLINGFRYNEGVLVSRLIIKNNVSDHGLSHEGCIDERCSECSDTKEFRIYLYSSGVLARSTYNADSETNLICSICGGDALKCDCIIVEEDPVICDKCGELKGYCICEIFKCDECGQDPCECPINSGDEDDNNDGEDEGSDNGSGENSGGASGENTSRTPYLPANTDKMANVSILNTMEPQTTIYTCVPDIMQFVYVDIYGGNITRNDLYNDYWIKTGRIAAG